MAQTFIFINSKDFAEKIHLWLREAELKSYIMYSDLSNEIRDQTIERFRKGEIQVLITTNLIARGIDVPEVELVINYDVPQKRVGPFKQQSVVGDPETYLHRIARTGRFGRAGIAVTIYDRDVDKEYIDQIVDYYGMQDLIKTLKDPQELKEIFKSISE